MTSIIKEEVRQKCAKCGNGRVRPFSFEKPNIIDLKAFAALAIVKNSNLEINASTFPSLPASLVTYLDELHLFYAYDALLKM